MHGAVEGDVPLHAALVLYRKVRNWGGERRELPGLDCLEERSLILAVLARMSSWLALLSG